MNSLRIVKNAEGVNGVMLSNHCMLMVEDTDERYGEYIYQKYYMYDLEKNTKIEIAPNIPKLNIVKLTDIEKHPNYIYFSNINIGEENIIEIRLFRYSIETKICKKIHSIMVENVESTSEFRVKVFVINEFYLIIQREYLRKNLSEDYEGFFDFNLTLFNMVQDEIIEIVDENLVSNGIFDIRLISENICVIKTGFSMLLDKRYEKLTADEASVESISFVNLGQLVSDIIIQKKNIVFNTIEQAFFTNTIPYIRVNGEYLVYSIYNINEKEEKVVFYNVNTKVSQICINKNEDKDYASLAKTLILKGRPYLRIDTDEQIEFYNVEDKKVDFVFKTDMKFETAIKNIIISSTVKKTIFGNTRHYFNVHSYPGLSVIHHEKGKYLGCVADSEGKIYILTKKG